jgi:riboflavin transporter FmnP
LAVLALSVGLGFFFLVPGSVGYGVGIAMFIVAGLLFVIGELTYFSKMSKIKRQED